MQLLGGARRAQALSASPLPPHEAGVMQLLWTRTSLPPSTTPLHVGRYAPVWRWGHSPCGYDDILYYQ